jgi:hypothetical protein
MRSIGRMGACSNTAIYRSHGAHLALSARSRLRATRPSESLPSPCWAADAPAWLLLAGAPTARPSGSTGGEQRLDQQEQRKGSGQPTRSPCHPRPAARHPLAESPPNPRLPVRQARGRPPGRRRQQPLLQLRIRRRAIAEPPRRSPTLGDELQAGSSLTRPHHRGSSTSGVSPPPPRQ